MDAGGFGTDCQRGQLKPSKQWRSCAQLVAILDKREQAVGALATATAALAVGAKAVLAGNLAGQLPSADVEGDHRRALELLARCTDGCSEAVLLAHGFRPKLIPESVRTGLATTQTEHVRGGGRVIDVSGIRITNAGRRALAEGR
jgi:hypothetical protein